VPRVDNSLFVGLGRCEKLFDLASKGSSTLPEPLAPLVERATKLGRYCKINIDNACIRNGTAAQRCIFQRGTTKVAYYLHYCGVKPVWRK
jgi:hypothetical protein